MQLHPVHLPMVAAGLLAVSAGCSQPTAGGSVRTVPEAPGELERPEIFVVPTPRAVEPGDGSGLQALGVAAGEPLEVAEEPLTTRRALERALELAADGLRSYERGEPEAALKSLSDARIMLLEANLPEAMQEQGLSVLQGAVAEEFRHHDLEAVAQVLELEALPASGLAEREIIEREMRRILQRFGAPMPKDATLEIILGEVQHYIDFYRGSHRRFFERSYGRKHKYWPTIEAVFTARSIPVELGYMALVESGFNPRARSRAGARGVWQFIPATGKRYGLRRVDDFYDVHMATEAAAEYLLDLIGIFGSHSFLLATAAYNAGERRIENCLRKLDDPFEERTFWDIRSCLARETREYVPRILAAAVIGADPRRFGFDLPSAEEVRRSYDVVTVPHVARLSHLARQAGVRVADLRAANSDLAPTAKTTPARNFPLYVPKGGGPRLAASLSASPGVPAPKAPEVTRSDAARTSPGRSPAPARTRPAAAPVEYVARRGDTLSEIAERHAVRVADIKEWNTFLRHRTLYRGDRLTLYPGTGGTSRVVYRVVTGDTLSEIAERHGVRYSDVASWNDLRRPYRLRVGQELVIYSGDGAPARIVYTVRRGNSLQAIAELFAVRYRDIMSWNGLKRSTLRVGQELVIHPPRPLRRELYQVRRGDTVGRIARRFGVPVRNVLTANGLGRRSVIRPGQRLVVYVG